MTDSSLHPDVDVLDRPYCHLPHRPVGVEAACLPEMLRQSSWLRIILIGSPADVNREMLNLYHCGYDLAGWSSPQRIPGSTEVITVYGQRSLS